MYNREARKDEHIRKFHQTLIGGAFTSDPSVDMVTRHKQRVSIVLNREKANFEKWNPVEPVVPIPCWKCNGKDHQGDDCDGRDANGIDDNKSKKGGKSAAAKGGAAKGGGAPVGKGAASGPGKVAGKGS
jgi:hypothetical protein